MVKNNYNYIIFDWDGCLAQTLDLWIDSCHAAIEKQGIVASKPQVWQSIRDGGIASHYDILDWQLFQDDVTAMLLTYSSVELYDGALTFLHRHAPTKKLAIVSNSRNQVLRRALMQHNLADYFSAIIDDQSGVAAKPAPGGIYKAMELIAAIPEQTIMVGDSITDINGAHNAGITAALFYPPSHHELYGFRYLVAARPRFVVKNFLELTAIIT